MHRRPSIRTLQLLLVVACVLPASFAVAVALVHSYQVERAALVERTLATARALSWRIDSQLSDAGAMLRALATSPALQRGDLASFEAQARRVARYQPGDTLALSDASGAQLFFAQDHAIYTAAIPVRRRHAALSVDEPVVSDLFVCDVLHRPLVTVGVPLKAGQAVAYRLAIGFFPEHLNDVLSARPVSPDWVVSVFDRKGTIIARTLAADQLVGLPAAEGLQRAMLAQREGTLQVTLRDGRPVLAAFSRASVAAWPVMIGIPERELMRQLQRSLVILAVATAVLLLAGSWLARRLAIRIERSIQSLVAPAVALGHGEPVVVRSLPLREAEMVARALRQASELLAARTAQRDSAAQANTRLQAHANQLAYEAGHDPLTGLLNRAGFHLALTRHFDACACGHEALVVLFADVDDFKAVNDQRGHAVGDEVLQIFARRLLASVRETDAVARLGGDEFAILLCTTLDHAQALARQLTESLSQPYEIRGERVQVSASIGVARCAGPGSDAAQLLEAADAAMYRAKAGGKRGFAVGETA